MVPWSLACHLLKDFVPLDDGGKSANKMHRGGDLAP